MLLTDLRLQMLPCLGGVAHLPQQLNVITGQGIELFLVPFHHYGLADRWHSFCVGQFKVGADGLIRLLVVRWRGVHALILNAVDSRHEIRIPLILQVEMMATMVKHDRCEDPLA